MTNQEHIEKAKANNLSVTKTLMAGPLTPSHVYGSCSCFGLFNNALFNTDVNKLKGNIFICILEAGFKTTLHKV